MKIDATAIYYRTFNITHICKICVHKIFTYTYFIFVITLRTKIKKKTCVYY